MEKENILENHKKVTFEDWMIELEHSKIRMNIFNINIDLYWPVKSLLGKSMEERGRIMDTYATN